MPELPEVETISRYLREEPSIVGRRIEGVHLFWDRTIAEPSPEAFKERIAGQVIQSVGRRGKFVLINLSEDTLLIHLRMSGDLLVEEQQTSPATHHRLMLDLEGGIRLSFNDTRKFGRVWLVSDPDSILSSLGPEPLSPSFTPEELYRLLQARKRQIKPLLLDQSFVAGLGNIYADEALHLAKIHPLRVSNTLEYPEVERLWESIREVLREGIRRHGASIDWVYRGGDFQNYFRVYGRAGEPCPVCGTPIERIVVGQRSTHYCPECQPLL